FGIQRAARMFDDARAKQFPGLDYGAVVFILQLDRYSSKGSLVAISNLIQPLIKIQRSDHASFQRNVRSLVDPGDLHHRVLSGIAVAVLADRNLCADGADLLKSSLRAVGVAVP